MPIPVEELEKRSEAFLDKLSKLPMPEKIRAVLELFRYKSSTLFESKQSDDKNSQPHK